MRPQIFFLSLASGALGSILGRGGCAADNCARAVTGTRYAAAVQAQHTADCSSFMAITVTPPAPVTTITIRTTSYSVIGSNVKRDAVEHPGGLVERGDLDHLLKPPTTTGANVKRDAVEHPGGLVKRGDLDYLLKPPTTTGAPIAARQFTYSPSEVPPYATACNGPSRYSSACSCAGITQVTSYAPTPATITSTYHAAPSIIPVCDPADNYGFKYAGGSIEDGVSLVSNNFAASPAECCAACFTTGSACFAYTFFENVCGLIVETAGSKPPTNYCPYGIYGISSPGPGSFYGPGPCGHF